MKKTLCFALILTLLLPLAACGRTPEPTAEPTVAPAAETQGPEPTPVPTAETAPTAEPLPTQEPQEPQTPLERALAYLRRKDKDWNYASRHLGTYQELYTLLHPGADVQILGGGIGAKEISVSVTGADARAFAEAGYLPDRITVSPVKNGDPCFSRDLPIPREPETDRVSERGMRVTMERAVWPVGAEYLRCTLGNETDDWLEGEEVCLEKYTEEGWKRYVWPGMNIGTAFGLEPHSAYGRLMDLQLCPRLGEGLYRIIVCPGEDWAEFVLRADGEPLDPEPLVRQSWPEAALLLAGLPEGVESDLTSVQWPAVSHTWRLAEEPRPADEELADLLLGEGAAYDPAAEVWRAGELTLSPGDTVRLESDTPIARALRLVLPLRDPETLDPRDIPSLEAAGWISMGIGSQVPGLSSLFPQTGFRCCCPDIGVLNARLEAALETLGPEDPRYAELADFRFTQADAAELRLALRPIYTTAAEGRMRLSPVSPWGELEEATAWCLYREDQAVLWLEARYLDYRLEPVDSWATRSPLEKITRFLPLMAGEEELRLTRMDYVLIPGNEEGVFQPAWRLLAETASGEELTWVASTRNDRQSAYDLQRRAYLLELQKPNGIRHTFRSFREEYPDMDVWEDSWGIDLLEDGRDYLMVLCHGADIPALEASGTLPEGVVLDWIESPFNQKESHPCPHEPEGEKDWGTVCFTIAEAAYPPYPEAVELTAACENPFELDKLICKKYVDEEWRNVCPVYTEHWRSLTLEPGETTLQVYPAARLGPGLYRLYMNNKFWVEFKVSEPEE